MSISSRRTGPSEGRDEWYNSDGKRASQQLRVPGGTITRRSAKWLGLPFLPTAFLVAMLACGPAAPSDPGQVDALPALSQLAPSDPALPVPVAIVEEPTAIPLAAPPQRDPESGATGEPTPTPTPEPTFTPTPFPDECIPLPAGLQERIRQSGKELPDDQKEENGTIYQCYPVVPTPTPKYPALGRYSQSVQALETAQEQASSQGQDAQQAIASQNILVTKDFVRLKYDTMENMRASHTWLIDQLGDGDDNFVRAHPEVPILDVVTPILLLGPLSQQTGFQSAEPAQRHYLINPLRPRN